MSEGGGGLSTIWGFGFVKREKKLAHMYLVLTLSILISFDFITGGVIDLVYPFTPHRTCREIHRHDIGEF
jgi:hypothetical protein